MEVAEGQVHRVARRLARIVRRRLDELDSHTCWDRELRYAADSLRRLETVLHRYVLDEGRASEPQNDDARRDYRNRLL
ncbi:Uncharacterized protein PBTT_08056 [Plasmodiophora brassicae]